MKSSYLSLAVALFGTSTAFDLPDLYKNKTVGGVWYGGWSLSPMGHCGLGPPTQAGVPIHYKNIGGTAGVNSQLYAFNPCGMCLRVKFVDRNESVDVFVNDECTTCGWSELNLGIEGEGYQNAVWQAITCNVGKSPLEYFFEAGHEYYLKLQPRTSRCVVKEAKALVGDEWRAGVHTDDNFFEFKNGPFNFPLKVQLTSIFGEVVEDEIPAITIGSQAAGSKGAQFASCKKPKPAEAPAEQPPAQPAPEPAAPTGN